MHRLHVHHHHRHPHPQSSEADRGPGRRPGRGRGRGRRGLRFDPGSDRDLGGVIAVLEERQRDLEQAAADLADTIRRLRDRQAGSARRPAEAPTAAPADADAEGADVGRESDPGPEPAAER